MRIALIGDSQSEVLWPLVKKAMPEHEFVLTRTQRGWESWHFKNEGKLEQELKDAKPELVVIELGGNNFFTTEAKYGPLVDWILNAARASGARHILWIGPATATKSPNKENKEWTNAFQKKHMSGMSDVTWFDSFPHTQTGHTDGVHFGMSTYKPWSEVIVPAIRDATGKASGFALVPRSTGGKIAAGIVLVAILAGIGYAVTAGKSRP